MIALQLLAGLSVVWWSVQGLLFLRARWSVLRLEGLPEAAQRLPRLSVVMPARNEAAHLTEALESKLRSSYPDVELVLVNDRSSDETGALADAFARRDPRLRVVHLETLPPDWLGKVHAMAKGLEAATGEYVLFSDADVVIAPGTLERVVAECERRGLDFFAVFPSIRARTPLLVLALSTMFRVLVLFTRPWAVRDATSSAFFGVGAFNLVRRSALARTRGLEWLKLETGDDVALGMMLKQSGARCEAAIGGSAVSLDFYPSYAAAMRAVEKNGASGPFPALVAVSVALIVLELGFGAGFALGGGFAIAAAGVALGGPVLTFAIARWLGFSGSSSPFTALGVLPFSFMMLRSAVLALVRGGVVWRGTFYPTKVIAAGRRLFRVPGAPRER